MAAVPPPAGFALPPVPARARPVNDLGTAALVLGATALGADLLRTAATWLLHGALSAARGGGVNTLVDGMQLPLLLMVLLGSSVVLVPTLIAAVVTSLVWVHRARTNAEVLSPRLPFRHTPAASVGLLLVPIANLWFLRSVLSDICTGSSPWGPDARGARLVRGCWTTTLITAVVSALGQLALMVVTAQLTGSGGPVDEELATRVTVAGLALATLNQVLLVACAVSFGMVVRHVTRRQTAALSTPGPRW